MLSSAIAMLYGESFYKMILEVSFVNYVKLSHCVQPGVANLNTNQQPLQGRIRAFVEVINFHLYADEKTVQIQPHDAT